LPFDDNYIFAVESILVESIIVVESIVVESIMVESIFAESEDSSDALLALQAITDKDNANAKNPNLKKFFMLISFNG